MKPELERTPMPDVTEEEIQKVLALAEKASPGPWTCELHDIADVWMIGHKNDYNFASVYFDNESQKHQQPGRDAAYIAFANPAFVKRLASELLSLRKSSHSVSQCCPMSERLQKRVEELEAIIASGLSGEDKAAILKLLTLTRKSSRDMTGPELKAAREAAGLTIEQAAKLTTLPVEIISNYETGRVELVGLYSTIAMLDRIYGLNRAAAAEASAKGVKS